MKHIYLNLKRFDIPVAYGGVNRLAPVKDWGAAVVRGTQEALGPLPPPVPPPPPGPWAVPPP